VEKRNGLAGLHLSLAVGLGLNRGKRDTESGTEWLENGMEFCKMWTEGASRIRKALHPKFLL
jgi:hypothetical protein